MEYCYHCFRELKAGREGSGGVCPFCGTPFRHLNSFDRLMCGSVLAGRFLVGHARETNFIQTYIAFDWQEKKRVILWEFFPYSHARREVGLPQVVYHSGGFGIDGSPESDPSYWLEKYRQTDSLAAKLGADPLAAHFPRRICAFQENNTAYTVTEDVEGETLEAYLNSKGGTVAWLEALRLLAPAAEALSTVHQLGAVHGALSPERIILTRDGAVKLLDTGIYSAWDDYSFAIVDDAWPTHWEPYHLFSIFCEKPTLDAYSLAACFYRAVAGVIPDAPDRYKNMESLPLPEGRAGCVPNGMERVLLAALRFSPKEYPSVEAFWQALETSARQES